MTSRFQFPAHWRRGLSAPLTAAPETLEQDVKAVLSKVSLGEVDAALVYKTDVKAAGAKAFIEFVLSHKGKAVLTEAGFGAP